MADRVGAMTEEVKKILDLADEHGIDLSKTTDHMRNAEALVDAADYLNAIKEADLAREGAYSEISDVILDRVKDLEGKVKEGEEIGAEVKDTRNLLSDARKAARDRDFSRAFELLDAAKEEIGNACFQTVLKIISESRGNFLKAKAIGADISEPLKVLNQARDALRRGEYKKSIEYARKGDEMIERLVGEFQKAEKGLEQVEENLGVASELGIDTTFSEKLVEEARSSLEAMNFQKALQLINKSREKIEKAEYEKVMDVIETAEVLVALGEKMGVDTGDLSGMLEKAIKAAKDKEFKDAFSTANEVKVKAEDMLRTKILEHVEFIRTRAHNIGVADEGEVASLLEYVEESLTKGEVEEAYKTMEKAEKAVDRLQRERVERVLKEVEEGITALEELGAEVARILPAFNRAASLLKEGDYENAAEAAKDCLARTMEMEKEAFEESFSNAKLSAIEAKRRGLDITRIKEELEKARDLFAVGRYREAISHALEAKDIADTMKEKHQEAYDAIREAAALISEAKKDGVDIKPVAKILVKAKKALEDQEFDKAVSISEACKESLNKIKAQYAAAKNIVASQKMLNVASEINVDVSSYKDTLEKAKELMKEKKFHESSELASVCRETLEEAIEGHIMSLIDRVDETLEEGRKVGIKTDDMEPLIGEAKQALKEGEYRKAYTSAKKAMEQIEELRELSQKAVIMVQELKTLISNAQNLGADVKAGLAMLDKAIDEIKENKYKDALRKLEVGKRLIEDAQEKKVRDVLSSFEKAIEKVKNKMDTSRSEDLLSQARKMLEEKKYKEALNLAMQSEEALEKVSLQQKMAEEGIHGAKDKLKDMESRGIPITKPKAILEKAEKAFNEKDYVQALSLAVEAGEIAHLVEETHEETKEFILQAVKRLKALKDQGADVKSAESIMASAHSEFKNQEYSKARKYAEEALAEAEKKYHEFVAGKLEEVREEFKEVERWGGSTDRAEHLHQETLKALESREYSKVFAMIDKIRVVLNYEIKSTIRKKISSVEVALEEAKSKGVDVSKAGEKLRDALAALDKNDFEKASRFAEETSSLLSNVESERKELEDALLAAESLIDKARKIGIDIKKARAMIAEAREVMGSDVERALSLAETAKEEAERVIEEYAPRIGAELILGDVFAGEWASGELVLKNTGRALGKNVMPKITGVAVQGLDVVPLLKVGGVEQIPIQIKADRPGDVKVVISGDYISVVDGKQHPFELETVIHVKEKRAPMFKKTKLEAVDKCGVCNGTMKVGMEAVICECGKAFHVPCAGRKKVCPVCGRPISEDEGSGGAGGKDAGAKPEGGTPPTASSQGASKGQKKKLAIKLG
ncbi:MAG: hypothetical protein J7L61_00685 [Thermoplasmata archaeon]|nr:hypothetical protein [Thermoplasmata archaeon]